ADDVRMSADVLVARPPGQLARRRAERRPRRKILDAERQHVAVVIARRRREPIRRAGHDRRHRSSGNDGRRVWNGLGLGLRLWLWLRLGLRFRFRLRLRLRVWLRLRLRLRMGIWLRLELRIWLWRRL